MFQGVLFDFCSYVLPWQVTTIPLKGRLFTCSIVPAIFSSNPSLPISARQILDLSANQDNCRPRCMATVAGEVPAPRVLGTQRVGGVNIAGQTLAPLGIDEKAGEWNTPDIPLLSNLSVFVFGFLLSIHINSIPRVHDMSDLSKAFFHCCWHVLSLGKFAWKMDGQIPYHPWDEGYIYLPLAEMYGFCRYIFQSHGALQGFGSLGFLKGNSASYLKVDRIMAI